MPSAFTSPGAAMKLSKAVLPLKVTSGDMPAVQPVVRP